MKNTSEAVRKFLKEMAASFFIISTLVNVAIFVLGSLFNKDARFGYDAFLAPLVYAAFSLLPFGITFSVKELSVRETVVRKAVQLMLIEIILFLFGFGVENLSRKKPVILFSFGLSIAVIYVLVHVISWLIASKEAKALTEEIKIFQKRQ